MAAAPLANGTGAISGVVLDAQSRQPVPGTAVQLTMNGRPLATISRQLTDTKGRFVFTLLPASTSFGLSAGRAGYADGKYGDRETGGEGRQIALADGQWIQDIEIDLIRPGSISGTITDERGEPVIRAYVRVLAEVWIGGHQHLTAGPWVQTDDRGVYRVSGLGQGRYVIYVPSMHSTVPTEMTVPPVPSGSPNDPAIFAASNAAAVARSANAATAMDDGADVRLVLDTYVTPPPRTARVEAYPTIYYPSGTSPADAQPVRLASGEERRNVDIQLRVVPAYRITGRLNGPPAAYSQLLLKLIPVGSENVSGGASASAIVASNGQFAFLDVPAGQYTIEGTRRSFELTVQPSDVGFVRRFPTPPGFVFAQGMGGSVGSLWPNGVQFFVGTSDDEDLIAHQRVDVSADVANLVVDLRPTITVRGRFVTPPDAPPAPFGPIVQAQPADGSASLSMLMSGVLGRQAQSPTFTIKGLLPGRYVLRTLGPNRVKSIMWNGKDYTAAPIDTTNGQDLDDVVITFTTERTQVSGTVTPSGGGPKPALVVAFPAERELWTDYGLSPNRLVTATVSTANAYTIGALPAGRYLLIALDASKSDAWRDPSFLASVAGQATAVSIDWGEKKTQDLQMRVIR